MDQKHSAFRVSYSTLTPSLKVTSDLEKAMDDRNITSVVLLKFSNAFDTVVHKLLFSKPRPLNLYNIGIEWFESDLYNRTHWVYNRKGDQSAKEEVKRAVPKGSL